MISCTKNEVSDLNVTNPDVITFDTYVGQTTKGTILDQTALKGSGFGLMAYYTEQDTWDEGEGKFAPNFMYNQSVTYNYDSSVWSYNPIKYWPNEELDKVTFFAYAPYESSTNRVKGSYTANTAEGLPQVWMKLKDYAVNMVDFVAGQNMDMVRQQERVTFMLKHQLTRATFSAKTKVDNVSYGANASGDGASFVVVKSMNVIDSPEFFTEGVYTFDNETTDDVKTNHNQDGTWEVSEPANYSFESIMAFNNTETDSQLPAANYDNTGIVIPIAQSYYTSLFTKDQYLFLLPPNGAEGLSDDGIQVEIVYDIVTIDSQLDAGHSVTESTYVVTLPAATLAQGKAYNYQLEFDVTEILVRAEVVDWDNEGSIDAGIVDPFDDTIDNPVTALNIGVNQTISVGESVTITPNVTYTDETAVRDDQLTWKSSSDCISIVKNEDGSLTVTGAAAGVSTVTLSSASGSSASVEITVEASGALSIHYTTNSLINKTQLQTAKDDDGNSYQYTIVSPVETSPMHTLQLYATFTSTEAEVVTEAEVEWSIEVLDGGAADGITVSGSGLVTGVLADVSAVVTATYTMGSGEKLTATYFVATLDLLSTEHDTSGFDAYLKSNTTPASAPASNPYLSSLTRSGGNAATVGYDESNDTYMFGDKTYYSVGQSVAINWPANTPDLLKDLGVYYKYDAYSSYIYLDGDGKVYAAETHNNIEIGVYSNYDPETYNEIVTINVVVDVNNKEFEATEVFPVATKIEIVTTGLTNPIEYAAGVTVGTISATTNGVDNNFEWSTSPAGILDIDTEGNVKFSEGSVLETTVVTITATDKDGVSGTTTVTVVVSSIDDLSADTDMTIGERETISVTLSEPSTYSESDIDWSTSDAGVATVENGVVTAVGVGTATITATLPNGQIATLGFAVSPVAVSGVEIIGAATIDMATATSFVYTATVSPDTVTDQTVAWAVVSGPATIDNGVLTPTAVGTVVISATAGNVTVEKTITVTTSATVEINFNGDTADGQLLSGSVGLKDFFKAVVTPDNLSNPVVWSANDDSVLTIDSATGEFIIAGGGYVTITATVAGAVDTLNLGVTTFGIGSEITGGDIDNENMGSQSPILAQHF